MNAWVVAIAAIVVGAVLGGIVVWTFTPAARRGDDDDQTVAEAKWERTGSTGMTPAIRHLRHLYPTHDVVTNVPFLELATSRGTAGDRARRRAAAWTIPAAMVDKRTARLARVVLWDDDANGPEKADILRRLGIKVAVMPAGADADAVEIALAA